MGRKPEEHESQNKQLAPYLGLGMQLTLAMVLFGALGWWLDGKWGTRPWLLAIGCLLGATGGMISLIRTALRKNEPSESETDDQPGRPGEKQ